MSLQPHMDRLATAMVKKSDEAIWQGLERRFGHRNFTEADLAGRMSVQHYQGTDTYYIDSVPFVRLGPIKFNTVYEHGGIMANVSRSVVFL